MELKDVLDFVQEYLGQYILQVTGFFRRHYTAADGSEAKAKPGLRTDGRILVFALISLLLGASLQGVALSREHVKDIDFPQLVILIGGYWFTACLLFHLTAKSLGLHVDFELSSWAILSTLPTAYLISAYVGFVVYIVLSDLSVQYFLPAALLLGTATIVTIMAAYLPFHVDLIAPDSGRKKGVLVGATVLMVLIVQLSSVAAFALNAERPCSIQHASDLETLSKTQNLSQDQMRLRKLDLDQRFGACDRSVMANGGVQ